MNELDQLARSLRQELGAPPVEWRIAQRRRLRTERVKTPSPPRAGWALVLALTCVLLGIGFVALDMPRGLLANKAESANEWLEATSSRLPYLAPDGSSIQLEEGSRGRFSSDEDGTQFDLHGGRATFEVKKRDGQDWTVVAGRYSLHVVGTRFVVNYQRGDMGVWVDEGILAVSVPQRDDPFLLEAGDHLQTAGSRLTIRTRNDDFVSLGGSAVDELSESNDSHGPIGPVLLPDAPPTPVEHERRSGPARANVGWHDLYVQRQYAQALGAAKRLDFDRLTQSLGASKLVDLADTARLGGDSDAALKALRALETRFASMAVARDSDFLVARLLTQRGETTSAIQRLAKYLERGEGARYSLEALGRLVELHARRGDKQARALAQRYLERAPNGPYHRLAESILEQR